MREIKRDIYNGCFLRFEKFLLSLCSVPINLELLGNLLHDFKFEFSTRMPHRKLINQLQNNHKSHQTSCHCLSKSDMMNELSPLTIRFTPQVGRSSVAADTKSLPYFFSKMSFRSPSSGISEHLGAANIKLAMPSFRSTGHSLKEKTPN